MGTLRSPAARLGSSATLSKAFGYSFSKGKNHFLFLCWKGLVWGVKIQKKDSEFFKGGFYHDLVCLLGARGITEMKKEESYEKVVLTSPEHSDSDLM